MDFLRKITMNQSALYVASGTASAIIAECTCTWVLDCRHLWRIIASTSVGVDAFRVLSYVDAMPISVVAVRLNIPTAT